MINYCKVSTDKSWFAWALWTLISPGRTAIFMLITAIYFYVKANHDPVQKSAYEEAALTLGLWAIINILAFIFLFTRQKISS